MGVNNVPKTKYPCVKSSNVEKVGPQNEGSKGLVGIVVLNVTFQNINFFQNNQQLRGEK